MADEQPPVSSAVDEQTTAASTNGEAAVVQATQDSNASSTEAANAELTDADITAAGPQATVKVNAPDGQGTAEADPVAAAEDAAAAAAPADPSSSSKSKRKSSSGVPEHKAKKLNKKKSMPNLNLDVSPGEHYWARLKGFPPWPSICCDEDMLPESLLGSRPVSTKRPDGTYREDYLEGGKNARDRTYPMMFLATNEFAWMVNTSITKLDPSECVVKEGDKKLTKDLKAAYEIAAEQHDLDHFKGMLKQHEDELREFAAEQARLEAEKADADAAKAQKASEKAAKEPKKKSRKSKGGDDDDEMDVDKEEKSTSKKRKKEADSEGEESKPKKTPKVKLNAKDSTPASTKKAKAKKVAPKPEVSDDEEPARPLTEAERMEKREKLILYLRHRLQRGFVQRDAAPKEEEMADMSGYLDQLEALNPIEPQIIRATKIHKVLKAIIKLEPIPKDDEYHFKKRSSDLLNAWNSGLDGAADAKAATPNGEDKAEKKEDIERKTEESSAAPVEVADPGNNAVDEGDLTMADVSVVEGKADKPTEGGAEVGKAEAEAETEAPAAETAAA